MTNSNGRRKLEPLEHEALEWILQLTSGTASEADAKALQHWRDRSPAHAAAFTEALRFRRTLRAAAREFVEDRQASPGGARSRPRVGPMTRRAFLGSAIAASAAGVMVVRPPFSLWPSLAEMTATYRTGTGEQRHVDLAEGISLELNTQTSIAHATVKGGSAIELIAGEAEISAAVDPAVPFTAIAADGSATASQARFNLRHDDAGVCVTCLEGMTEVSQRHRAVQLQPGQQVTYTADGLGGVAAVDTEVVTAWRDGLLIFHDRPLTQVVDEVNRYRPGKVILTNEALGRLTVNGVFHLDRIGDVIEQFRKLGVQVTSLPGGIVFLS